MKMNKKGIAQFLVLLFIIAIAVIYVFWHGSKENEKLDDKIEEVRQETLKANQKASLEWKTLNIECSENSNCTEYFESIGLEGNLRCNTALAKCEQETSKNQ